ncbi:50S ribosomal protein L35 [Candidatus Dependentiae bacterium]
MPKMKTHSASKKRFKKSSTGKIKRSKAYNRHHAWAKTSKQGRKLRLSDYLKGKSSKNITKLLPYS